MKAIFMGTPEFSVGCFRALAEKHEVLAAFTQPDKPKGRGHQLQPTPVKEAALALNIPVYQPKTLKDGEAEKIIREIAPDVIVVVAYGKILPKEILKAAPYGCINVHASLLPKLRGAGPIQWSVILGEKETGVTTMQMDEGVDTGDMLLWESTPIGPDETAGEVHDRLAEMGPEVLLRTLEGLSDGSITPKKQDEKQSTHAPMLQKSDGILDFQKPARVLHNQIRGLNPWPVAETTMEGKRMKVYRSRVLGQAAKGKPGTLMASTEEGFLVATGEGALLIEEVQFEGKKRMHAADYARGNPVAVGSVLGEQK